MPGGFNTQRVHNDSNNRPPLFISWHYIVLLLRFWPARRHGIVINLGNLSVGQSTYPSARTILVTVRRTQAHPPFGYSRGDIRLCFRLRIKKRSPGPREVIRGRNYRLIRLTKIRKDFKSSPCPFVFPRGSDLVQILRC